MIHPPAEQFKAPASAGASSLSTTAKAVQLHWLKGLCIRPMRSEFPDVKVGDAVAVKGPIGKAAYLAQVLYVEGGARFSDPNFSRVHALLNRDACHR